MAYDQSNRWFEDMFPERVNGAKGLLAYGSSLSTIQAAAFRDQINVYSRDETDGVVNLPLRERFEQAYPSSLLNQNVVFKKLRSDYVEFLTYRATDPTGIYWEATAWSNRFNPGNQGVPIVRGSWEAMLFSSAAQGEPDSNIVTQTTDHDPAVLSIGTTDAANTYVGTWAGPATRGGVPDIDFTEDPNATVTVNLGTRTAGDMVYMRSYRNAANGATFQTRLLDDVLDEVGGAIGYNGGAGVLADTGTLMHRETGWVLIPLFRIPADGDYSLYVMDGGNVGPGSRGYYGGIEVYSAPAFDDLGLLGVSRDFTGSGGQSLAEMAYPGTLVSYALSNVTQIELEYYSGVNGGQVQATIYDDGGTPIASGAYTEQIRDTYATTAGTEKWMIAKDLPAGNYYLHLQTLPTQNASATAWTFFLDRVIGRNQTVAGVPGSDEFDDQTSPAALSPNLGSNHQIAGGGNWVTAVEMAEAGSPDWDNSGAGTFVGGVHGGEDHVTWADVTALRNSVSVDLDALADGAVFATPRLEMDFTVNQQLPATGLDVATMAYSFEWTRDGLDVTTLQTFTATVALRRTYVVMLQTPNGGATQSDALGGALNTVVTDTLDPVLYDQSDDTNFSSEADTETLMHFSEAAGYAILASLLNRDEQQAAFGGAEWNVDGQPIIRIRDLTSDSVKSYRQLGANDTSASSAGVVVTAGDAIETRKRYRTYRGANFAATIGQRETGNDLASTQQAAEPGLA